MKRVFVTITLLCGLLSCSDNKTEIIAPDGFESFSGKVKKSGKYYSTVLIRNPPENGDGIKRLMVQYFVQKAQYIDSIDGGSFLGSVVFYKHTRQTAYFIDHDEDPGGLMSYTLDLYNDAMIGVILVRCTCDDDSTKHHGFLILSPNLRRDTLYWECDGGHIDNWHKYK